MFSKPVSITKKSLAAKLLILLVVCCFSFYIGAIRAEARCQALPGAGDISACSEDGCCDPFCIRVCVTLDCKGGATCGPNGGQTCFASGCRFIGSCGASC